ncbi:septum formation protein Maf [Candida parapsilosis]|uniref:Maf-like protein n=2 Tax=Candida parapsilosis TaxID=5480 RepID=G8BKP9_CANPC|nr:uncharacterized protein CPAR2_703280 [Candida parapsilosis]KAF6042108.1 septum formation protein Maf [Candida parapsilosis]KAF6042387.1 septum formation protein Maf [Candida parapsilosis]KAF6042832.1 septum formation protein Maf [Candida parapsilosis]KAF6058159.1 septum formation protein Maf [Candida parapsilosis]KAI5903253.1 dTTP/UTP pyrophosphatase [Candida parapsilosis]
MIFNTLLNEKLEKYNLILGSTSPRRQQILLQNFGVANFTISASNFPEDLDKSQITPLEYVQLTSRKKAEAIYQAHSDTFQSETLILTCDTIVTCNGKIFEKPMTQSKQAKFFEYFDTHKDIEVISAITVLKLNNGIVSEYQDHAVTKLSFKADNKDIIRAYIESGEGLEVAGGFKYQQLGCLLFDKISGDYYNVVGLPTNTYSLLLEAVG